jgi:hypothetical protein
VGHPLLAEYGMPRAALALRVARDPGWATPLRCTSRSHLARRTRGFFPLSRLVRSAGETHVAVVPGVVDATSHLTLRLSGKHDAAAVVLRALELSKLQLTNRAAWAVRRGVVSVNAR